MFSLILPDIALQNNTRIVDSNNKLQLYTTYDSLSPAGCNKNTFI
jgi:hypothetical protein